MVVFIATPTLPTNRHYWDAIPTIPTSYLLLPTSYLGFNGMPDVFTEAGNWKTRLGSSPPRVNT